MKKKFSTVVLSCFACISMLAYSALPVHAIGPDTCAHPNFALGTDGPTGEYEYLESGHYEVWGTGHACLICGYEYYTDTHLVWESEHRCEMHFSECDGVEHKYYCLTDGCNFYITGPCLSGSHYGDIH